MTTFDFAVTKVCAGGAHVDVTVTNGAKSRVLHFQIDDLQETISDEQLEACLKTLIQKVVTGKNRPDGMGAIDNMSITI